MKNNYPIKYALMPLYKQTGWVHGLNQLERKYEIVAYIVSKCYVISENKAYSADGTSNIEYEVVFPYENIDNNNSIWTRTEPSINLSSSQISNSTKVKKIFDNYRDAIEYLKIKNNEILKNKISNLPFNESIKTEIKKLEDIHNEIINEARELEMQIQQNTPDLKLNEKNKEQSVIVLLNNKDKIINISLYSFIDLYDYDSFVVYTVSPEHYNLMKKEIIETGMLQDKSHPLSKPKYLLFNDINENIVKIANPFCNNTKGGFYLSNNHMHYNENMENFYEEPNFESNLKKCIRVYTTETYEDIIKSYIPYFISSDSKQIVLEGNTIYKSFVLKK